MTASTMDPGASREGASMSATPERESAPMPGNGLDTDASGVIQIGRGIDDVFAHHVPVTCLRGAGVRLGADRPISAMTTGAAAAPAGVLNKSQPARLPWGMVIGSICRS